MGKLIRMKEKNKKQGCTRVIPWSDLHNIVKREERCQIMKDFFTAINKSRETDDG